MFVRLRGTMLSDYESKDEDNHVPPEVLQGAYDVLSPLRGSTVLLHVVSERTGELLESRAVVSAISHSADSGGNPTLMAGFDCFIPGLSDLEGDVMAGRFRTLRLMLGDRVGVRLFEIKEQKDLPFTEPAEPRAEGEAHAQAVVNGLLDSAERLWPKPGSGIESVTISSGGRSVTMHADGRTERTAAADAEDNGDGQGEPVGIRVPLPLATYSELHQSQCGDDPRWVRDLLRVGGAVYFVDGPAADQPTGFLLEPTRAGSQPTGDCWTVGSIVSHEDTGEPFLVAQAVQFVPAEDGSGEQQRDPGDAPAIVCWNCEHADTLILDAVGLGKCLKQDGLTVELTRPACESFVLKGQVEAPEADAEGVDPFAEAKQVGEQPEPPAPDPDTGEFKVCGSCRNSYRVPKGDRVRCETTGRLRLASTPACSTDFTPIVAPVPPSPEHPSCPLCGTEHPESEACPQAAFRKDEGEKTLGDLLQATGSNCGECRHLKPRKSGGGHLVCMADSCTMHDGHCSSFLPQEESPAEEPAAAAETSGPEADAQDSPTIPTTVAELNARLRELGFTSIPNPKGQPEHNQLASPNGHLMIWTLTPVSVWSRPDVETAWQLTYNHLRLAELAPLAAQAESAWGLEELLPIAPYKPPAKGRMR
jgi:hypothetical protein